MKFIAYMVRAAISFFIAFIFITPITLTFFNFSGYPTTVDRILLVGVPTIALGILLFEGSPYISKRIRQNKPITLILLLFPAVLVSATITLPSVIPPASYLALAAIAIVLFLLMLPAAPAMERFRADHSLLHYYLGFLLTLIVSYSIVGILDPVLKTPFAALLLTALLTLAGSVTGYYLVRRGMRSFRNGFLHKPLNVLLVLFPPLLLAALIFFSLQFPAMFTADMILLSKNQAGWFILGALLAGVWGMVFLEQFEARGFYHRFSQTRPFYFIKDNLPGFYAAGMFFCINLVIALALNHPALSVNSVIFETDAGPWMTILASPEGDAINRSVHPLILITLRPLIRLVALFMGDQWQLAALLVTAALSGMSVLLAWLYVKRASGADTYAFIFALLLGSTATHLLFGSLTETHAFGMTALIFFFFLIQAGEKRLRVLVPAGLLLFGSTLSNIAQGVIGLFFNKFGIRRLVQFCVWVLALGIVLTTLTSLLYPGRQTLFFVPADLAFEGTFIGRAQQTTPEGLAARFQYIARTMLLYGVVGPSPLEIVSDKPPRPTIDLKTFEPDENRYASYRGLANVPLLLWLILVALSIVYFVKGFRSNPQRPLMFGLLGSLAFNFALHMLYGTELLLYTSFWTYALTFFTALALASMADRAWLNLYLAVFLLALIINNTWFILVIVRALAPFYTTI